MTASSQNPGPMPPESLSAPVSTTYADPWQGSDVPFALRSPYPEPALGVPACAVCAAAIGAGTVLRPDPAGRRYPSGAQVLYCLLHLPDEAPAAEVPAPAVVLPLAQARIQVAAAAVLTAAMAEREIVTGEDLAEAEHEAGILFDAANVEAAVSAAREQARAEWRAETANTREQLAVMAGSRRQRDAVLRLCEGRPGDDLLLVASVAVAAETGSTAVDGLPMTLTWNRSAKAPDAHDTHKTVVVECTSVYGGRADLVLTGDDRRALAKLLDAETVDIRHIDERCKHGLCGTTDDLDASDPALFGWTRIQVAGVEDEPRWYCSAFCVSNALADAAEDLAIADDLEAAGGAK